MLRLREDPPTSFPELQRPGHMARLRVPFCPQYSIFVHNPLTLSAHDSASECSLLWKTSVALPVCLSFVMVARWRIDLEESEPLLTEVAPLAGVTGRVVSSRAEHDFVLEAAQPLKIVDLALNHSPACSPVLNPNHQHPRPFSTAWKQLESRLRPQSQIQNLVYGCGAEQELQLRLRRLDTTRKSFAVLQGRCRSLGPERLCRAHRLIPISGMYGLAGQSHLCSRTTEGV